MPTFRATDPKGNVTEYVADVPNPEHLGDGWRLEEVVTVEPSPDDPVVTDSRKYGGRRILSRLEFLELFTAEERIAVRQARGSSAALDDYLYLMELADEVNLDSPKTQGGVMMLEQAGILASGRAQEILNG
jgi:hypothetical protein